MMKLLTIWLFVEESQIEFDVAYHGLDNTYIDLSFGSSGAQSYTISNSVSETGEPLNILFAHEEENNQLFGFGFSAGEARVLDNGDIQVFDLSGSVGYNTPDRNIDLNVYTFKTDGSAEVETIGMPQTFAFGYSAGESVKINDYRSLGSCL